MSRAILASSLLTVATVVACGPRGRAYELRGQILAVDRAAATLTIRHEDIPGFMPGMTMPFRVKDPTLIDGRMPGDLVRATLVVENTDAYLTVVEKTGWAPVEGVVPPALGVDLLEPGDLVPDQAFLNQDGRTIALTAFRGRALVLTFIYTRCPFPTFCPLMDRQFKAIQERLAGDPILAGRVRLLSVSFDPDYDTPAVLRAHGERLGADPAVWTFATADRTSVDRFGTRFGLTVARNAADPLDITHSLATAVIDPDGRLVAIHRGNTWTTDELVGDLRHAATER